MVDAASASGHIQGEMLIKHASPVPSHRALHPCFPDACLHHSVQVGDVSRRKELWVQPACDGEMSLSWVICWALTPVRRSRRDGHVKAEVEAGGLEGSGGAPTVQGIPNILTRERRDGRHTVMVGGGGDTWKQGQGSQCHVPKRKKCSKGCWQQESPQGGMEKILP